MSLDSLVKTVFRTALGAIPLWHDAGALESRRPAVITINGAFADRNHMTRLQQVLGPEADTFLMHLPSDVAPPLRKTSIAAFAAALSELIAREFAGRGVVLNGISVGALVAFAVRAPPVRGVVAVDPPLVMSKVWPLHGLVRQKLLDQPQDSGMRAFIEDVFGVTEGGVKERLYLPLLEDRQTPVDVIVGDEPLFPARQIVRYPSLVDEAERETLRRMPGVTLHVAPASGHNIPFHAPYLLRDVLLAACRAAANLSPAMGEALLMRAPITAERVLHLGPCGDAFTAGYLARNPKARVDSYETGSMAGSEPLADCVVAAELKLRDVPAVAALVAEGGWLIAGLPQPGGRHGADLLAALQALGLEALAAHPAVAEAGHFDDVAGDALSQLRAGEATAPLTLALRRSGVSAAQRLVVKLTVFAPTLMDIRTRLPAQATRSAPEVLAIYSDAKAAAPLLPADLPKVLILQRPALVEAERWRDWLAGSIAAGWVVVMEYDDHPALVSQVTGRDPNWARFRYPHAIQTSTRQLAEVFGQYNPEVKVFGNAVFQIAPRPERPAPRKVFYGAVWRGDFAVQVIRTLEPVAQEFPEVEFVVVGDRAVFDALPAARKSFHHYLPYEGYLELMADAAVSLSPIEGREHQDSKSDAKLLDAASRGVVTIASPTIYAETIDDGRTGLIAERAEDWAPLLAQTLRDEPRRLEMAQAAWDYV
ncbi:hypothetical protein, partial [Phenylobacterium sp.]|uniref:glycosyltransferase family protein n=1 Tax=Phenylobacterium sp. TaxID=1871053 RepID=UPI003982E3FB